MSPLQYTVLPLFLVYIPFFLGGDRIKRNDNNILTKVTIWDSLFQGLPCCLFSFVTTNFENEIFSPACLSYCYRNFILTMIFFGKYVVSVSIFFITTNLDLHRYMAFMPTENNYCFSVNLFVISLLLLLN